MDASLFEKIINTAQDCVFWKDENCRFLGVNKSFLEYYGFESADVLIGKTDEDMGWHNDEEPFKQDELRVLQGESTYKVHGKCMVGGEERDIIASKSPVIRNGKVVGLVGSFLDVTDVINKKSLSEYAQILYDDQTLRKIPFFDKVLDDNSLEDVLDPTTGLICRAYALEFAKNLIASNTPFSFSIVDLDNFKSINDTYGHHAGDRILMGVAKGLVSHTGSRGIAGRFGGDELLIIDLETLDFNDRLSFFENMYEGTDRVFRIGYDLDEEDDPVITATIGNAVYPDDADDYESLFTLMDKTLYHGKRRGRNCYTVYDPSKHADLEIRSMAKQGIYTSMHGIKKLFDEKEDLLDRLQAVMPVLNDAFQIYSLYYADRSGTAVDVKDRENKAAIGDISKICGDDVVLIENLEEIEGSAPELYKALKERNAVSVLITRIGSAGAPAGYLICPEKRRHRIRQEDEYGILFYLAGLAAGV